ncbi:helix-turn-helix domain-containing protein [Paenimyroides aestuarii]|uniref:Helix-turn-helix domain-containing protein n=1 Tax=Paenimyroides aestuarii TaxID=2968490 RepID=A0ABY5NV20_9FLAO|nr:helix-turn-helix transcriptional regulator [Paenimyroides aestuarii]UUV22338.1 helix-turn-helix domain-containing protein [Paenimyroides aestuarii]
MKEANERLRQLRKQKQYTQEDLAKKLGISLRAYSKIESGETQLTLERLNEILDILGVTALEFFSNESAQNKSLPATGNASIPLIQHYQETISMLKEHIETLKNLIEKK